ncbi:hypothetical protein MSL71_25940 [Desulfoluna butyratoxydans]|uniref:Uncharacterized protein n=1 Tax=Desulfoluna butyratoxydans TaxID=231438 RepID=A0A4U8YN26_9BACT|nr:hypothetical protein MSL71_25940 [Desulfoluna butyratoxydans]
MGERDQVVEEMMDVEAGKVPAPVWQSQRVFILGYVGVVLIPLFFLVVYACYDKGRCRGEGPVTITLTMSLYEPGRPGGSGGTRFSTMASPSRQSYTVWGTTETGQLCFIDVDSYLDYTGYTRGKRVETSYTVHKDRGDWRWTVEADFWVTVWCLALGLMGLRVAVTARGKGAG